MILALMLLVKVQVDLRGRNFFVPLWQRFSRSPEATAMYSMEMDPDAGGNGASDVLLCTVHRMGVSVLGPKCLGYLSSHRSDHWNVMKMFLPE